VNGYEVGNRSIATQATAEARNAGDIELTPGVARGKVLAVEDGEGNGYQIGEIDENDVVTRIHSHVMTPDGVILKVNDIVSLKVDERSGIPVILSGSGAGASSCFIATTGWGILID